MNVLRDGFLLVGIVVGVVLVGLAGLMIGSAIQQFFAQVTT